jgi:uncharacterized membrane protein YozB (DUF420 family)
LGPRPDGINGSLDVSALPTVNASLNALTTALLVLGYILIIQKKRRLHKNVMLVSFATSAAFLVSYIIYHWFKAGPKQYLGEYTLIYYIILLTHIILATIIIPLALLTLYRGWTDNLVLHRKIAKITLPLWLYVSVTGVVIYLMLY